MNSETFKKSLDLYFRYLDKRLEEIDWSPFTKDFRKMYNKKNGVYLVSREDNNRGMRYIGKSSQNLDKRCAGIYDRLGSHWMNIEEGSHYRKESTQKLFSKGKGADRFWVKCLTNSDGLLEGMEECYEKYLMERFRECNLINKNQ